MARCCELADTDELATQTFDCGACERRAWLAALWPENIAAWQIMTVLSHAVVREFGLGAYVLEALTADYPPAERASLIRRLGIIRSDGTDPEA